MLGLWYLPFGALLSIIQIVLLLLPALRSQCGYWIFRPLVFAATPGGGRLRQPDAAARAGPWREPGLRYAADALG